MHKNFEELTERVKALSKEEMERAKKAFPMYHSRHEGLGVLLEELWESGKEIEAMNKGTDKLRITVFSDSSNIESVLTEIEDAAIRAAAELIQVSAVCQKMIESEETYEGVRESLKNEILRLKIGGDYPAGFPLYANDDEEEDR